MRGGAIIEINCCGGAVRSFFHCLRRAPPGRTVRVDTAEKGVGGGPSQGLTRSQQRTLSRHQDPPLVGPLSRRGRESIFTLGGVQYMTRGRGGEGRLDTGQYNIILLYCTVSSRPSPPRLGAEAGEGTAAPSSRRARRRLPLGGPQGFPQVVMHTYGVDVT